MKKLAPAFLLVLSLAVVAGALAAAAPPARDVATLTRVAAKVSGLRAAHRVKVKTLSTAAMKTQARRLLDRDYPSAQQRYDESVYRGLGLLAPGQSLRPLLLAAATTNVLGLYDPATPTVYVRRGSGRQTLLRELVRALEDQSFDLRRVRGLRRSDRDAALAAAAAVDGEATFSTQVLGGLLVATSPRRTATTASAMAAFLKLEQQFPQTVGMRFDATLHNLGGNAAVLSSLRQLPATTAQVFHIDDFLMHVPAVPVQLPQSAAGLTLQHSDTFGELDVRALLAVFRVPRLDVAADGWTGGRSAVYTDASGHSAVSLALSWETEADVQEWREAVATYVDAAFDAAAPGAAQTTPCGSGDTCWSLGGRGIALAAGGTSTAFVVGPDAATADALAQAELHST